MTGGGGGAVGRGSASVLSEQGMQVQRYGLVGGGVTDADVHTLLLAVTAGRLY